MDLPDFCGPPSEATLHAYLSRAITLARGFVSESLDDDLRLIRDLGVAFLGRSALIWSCDPDDEQHFAQAAAFARRVHDEVDRRVVCQAAVFEAVYPEVERIAVPDWVFAAFDEPAERRTFRFADMWRADDCLGRWPEFGSGGVVPDLRQAEARRWFYYRCRRYLDAGFEAIHLGQPHLYAARDAGFALLDDLIARVRAYAATAARRRWVWLDAHTHGIVRGGRLLFDLHSRPISAVNFTERPERLILQLRGRSRGGVTPAGWRCASLPYLIEVDNWGGWSLPAGRRDDAARASCRRWGYDDIAWFAHQPAEVRRHFLRYAHRFLRVQDDAAHFQMPVRRLLGEAPVTAADGTQIWHYHANRPSPACPQGFGDEETIAAIWREADPAAGVERPPAVLGHPTLPDGLDAPQEVFLVGPLQRLLGGEPGDAMSRYSRLSPRGDGTFVLTCVIPWAGEHRFAVGIDGTMTEYYRQDGLPGGADWRLVTSADNQIVRLVFDYRTRRVTAAGDGAAVRPG